MEAFAPPTPSRRAPRRRLLACGLALALLAGCDKTGSIVGTPRPGGGPPSSDFNWVKQTPPASNHLYGVAFTDSLRGCVVGSAGLVLTTRDAGASWQRSTPTTFDLRSVWFSTPA